MKLTIEDFMLIGVKEVYIEPLLPYINLYFEKYGINTENRIKYALANIFHETNMLKALLEIGGGKDSYDGGRMYCGRGLPQLTHIRNYSAFQQWLKDEEGIVVDKVERECTLRTRTTAATLRHPPPYRSN